jgi:hypothetical protein
LGTAQYPAADSPYRLATNPEGAPIDGEMMAKDVVGATGIEPVTPPV